MTIEDAQRQLCDTIKAAVVARFGERFYEEVLTGHLLSESVDWFTPYLFGPAGRKAQPPVSPLSTLGEVAKWMGTHVVRPVLEVECGLGTLSATLAVEQAIDRDERQVALARQALPDVNVSVGGIESIEGEALFGSVVSAFGLGRGGAGRGTPVFLDFVTHANRLLTRGGLIMVAEKACYQDNLVEPLVALDYEILKMTSLKGSGSVLVIAQKSA